MAQLSLSTPLEYLKGIGPQRAEVLKKELNIFTLHNLLYYYPFRYVDRTKFYKISDLNADLPYVQVIGRLISKEIIGEKQGRRLIAKLKDETGIVELVWFQGIRWVEKSLQPNAVFIVFGKPNVFNGKISIPHPEIDLYASDRPNQGNLTLQPVYNSTEKLKQFSLDTKGIQRIQASAIDAVIYEIQETLPQYLLQKYKLISKKEAIQYIHFPPDALILQEAIKRLKFEELFFIQLKLLKNKLLRTQRFKGQVFNKVGEKFNTFYSSKLPFDLTNAQKRVLKEIRVDTQKGVQMNRLLQGDVGSGKTIVALMCMLLAIDNGCQACIMAPTEILAQQHYVSINGLANEDFI
ncbi:MAG: DEAD/DEAH box helicase, partial [Pyrinomonadaceae bacterium]|nr:DEAD/DEAH box helicase [Sphingobacteriaceae bacterium]